MGSNWGEFGEHDQIGRKNLGELWRLGELSRWLLAHQRWTAC